jgi:hypothetical protein
MSSGSCGSRSIFRRSRLTDGVHRALGHVGVAVPDFREERRPAEHDAAARGEQIEQIEFLLGEFDRRAAHDRFAAVGIERQFARLDALG